MIYQRLLGCNFQLFSGCLAGKTAVPGLETSLQPHSAQLGRKTGQDFCYCEVRNWTDWAFLFTTEQRFVTSIENIEKAM